MSVILDCRSAARLLGEGALCLDTDTDEVHCQSKLAQLPTRSGDVSRPILICGTSAVANASVAERLQQRGLPAWLVVESDDHAASGRHCGCVTLESGDDERSKI